MILSKVSMSFVNTFYNVCVVGDFNFPTSKWDGEWSATKGNIFVECVRDAFLTQMFLNPLEEERDKPQIC